MPVTSQKLSETTGLILSGIFCVLFANSAAKPTLIALTGIQPIFINKSILKV
jgi:xanthosine utilization system XapX-like protein